MRGGGQCPRRPVRSPSQLRAPAVATKENEGTITSPLKPSARASISKPRVPFATTTHSLTPDMLGQLIFEPSNHWPIVGEPTIVEYLIHQFVKEFARPNVRTANYKIRARGDHIHGGRLSKRLDRLRSGGT